MPKMFSKFKKFTHQVAASKKEDFSYFLSCKKNPKKYQLVRQFSVKKFPQKSLN